MRVTDVAECCSRAAEACARDSVLVTWSLVGLAAGVVLVSVLEWVALPALNFLRRGFCVRCPRCGGTGHCKVDSARLRAAPLGLSACQLTGCGWVEGSLWSRIFRGGTLVEPEEDER